MLCTHWSCLFFTRYDTQSGCGAFPKLATVCTVRFALPGVFEMVTVGGSVQTYPTMYQAISPTLSARPTKTAAMRCP